MPRMINPKAVARPVSPTYSQGSVTETGRLLFIAGQVGVDAGGELVADDIEAQTRQVYKNIRLILESEGASLADILHTDVFLVDVERDLEGYLAVRKTVFRDDPPPSTLIEVESLVAPDYVVEVKAVAELPEQPD